MKPAPARVSSPGRILARELEARGWHLNYLADVTGLPITELGKICAETQPVTPDIAEGLSHAIGASADFWLNLQQAWEAAKTVAIDRTATTQSSYPLTVRLPNCLADSFRLWDSDQKSQFLRQAIIEKAERERLIHPMVRVELYEQGHLMSLGGKAEASELAEAMISEHGYASAYSDAMSRIESAENMKDACFWQWVADEISEYIGANT